MATKVITKSAAYRIPNPASIGLTLAGYVDGIYVNTIFFEQGIAITGARMRCSSTRVVGYDLGLASSVIKIYTFSGGVVGTTIIGGVAFWQPGQVGPVVMETDLSNKFYGIGLNVIDVRLSRNMSSATPMIFNVAYTLEVDY